jgi:hypothetical protein
MREPDPIHVAPFAPRKSQFVRQYGDVFAATVNSRFGARVGFGTSRERAKIAATLRAVGCSTGRECPRC